LLSNSTCTTTPRWLEDVERKAEALVKASVLKRRLAAAGGGGGGGGAV
jgi:hypothetical protein